MTDVTLEGALPANGPPPGVYSLVTRALVELGVARIFGLVGEDTVVFVADATAAGIEYLGARHEAGAVAMADGYSWASGELGVCTVTRGPGITNALTACRTAVQGGRRVLVITGDVPIGGGGPTFKNIDQGPLCRSVGLEYFPAATQAEVMTQLQAAAISANAGRPAVLAVAVDVLTSPLEGDPVLPPGLVPAPGVPVRAGPGTDDLERMVEVLRTSTHPLLLAGRGASSPVCRQLLMDLAERTGALLGTTLLTKGLFGGSPYDLGVVGGFPADPSIPLLGQVDAVLVFGAGLNTYTTAGGTLFQGASIVQVDIDPSRIGAVTEVDFGVVADTETTLRQLLDVVPLASTADAPFHQPDVLITLTHPPYSGSDNSSGDELDPCAVATTLDELLPDDRVLVLDSGRFTTAPGRFIGVRAPAGIRHTADGGSIGLGLGVALGAAIGRPDRTTTLFAGDGGFSMAIADLETAVRHHIPLVIVVMDDKAYGSERRLLLAAGLQPVQAQLPGVDFAAVARALGIDAATVRTVGELRVLAPELADRRSPFLIHCHIRPDVDVPRVAWPERSPR